MIGVVLLSLMVLFDLMAEFSPALLSILKFLVFAVCLAVVVGGALILLIELSVAQEEDKLTEGQELWLESIVPLRRKTDRYFSRSPRLEQIFPYRILILLGCMALTGFGMGLS